MQKTVILLIIYMLTIGVSAFAFDITRNGKPVAIVVVDETATKAEITAANEFVKYISSISGASLPISNKPATNGNNIYIGQTKTTKSIIKYDWNKLKSDGILIKSTNNNLILAGDRPRGTLYAVYTFLEDYLGVKYFTPKLEVVPQNKSISIANNINYSYVPPFFSRETYYNNNLDNPLFAVKMKSNGNANNIPEELGSHIELIGWCHTFAGLIPEELYYKDHPEWFSLIDGKRAGGPGSQLCLSNPELLNELTKRVIERLDQAKDPRLISVTQNDNTVECQCENCVKLKKEYGTPSGLIIRAVNYVASKVKEKYPNVMVETLAYQHTLPAPKNIKPADNVIVRICDIENNFGEPIIEQSKNAPYNLKNGRLFPYVNQQTVNKDFYNNVTAWSNIAKNLFIWDYTVNFSNYHIVHPNIQVLQPNIKFFRDNHVKAVFEQGDSFNETVSFNELKSYLIAKLLWNPNADVDKLTSEFLNAYYGDGAKQIGEIINLCKNIIKDKKIFVSTYMYDISWMSPKEMIEVFKLFDEALVNTSGNKETYDRVLNCMMCFQYGWYLASPEIQKEVADSGYLKISDPAKYKEEYDKFAVDHNNKYISEGRPMNFAATPYALSKSGNIPEICKGLKDEDWIEIQDKDYGLFSLGNRDTDENASDKSITRLFPVNTEWSMQVDLAGNINAFLKSNIKSIDLYAVCKVVNKKNDEGNVVAIGIWDSGANTTRFEKKIPAKYLQNNTFTTVYLGSVAPFKSESSIFYIAPDKNPNVADSVEIDRIIGILKK